VTYGLLRELPLLGSNQDSPDPESAQEIADSRQNVVKPRVRVVRCRGSQPQIRYFDTRNWLRN
jgi:hypothetical protein